MSTPIHVSIPHELGRAEARRRIEAGFAQLVSQLPGIGARCSEQWEGDRLSFRVALLGQAVSGVLDVHEASVTMEVELPGLLGRIASSVKGRLQRAGQLLLTRK